MAISVLIASFGLTRLMRPRNVPITGGMALALLVFAFGGDELAGRVAREGVTDEGRFATYQRIGGAIGHAPWLGPGYGTFPQVYRAYQGGASNAS